MNSIIFTYQYIVQNYVTFTVTVNSGNFSGESNFCVSSEKIKEFVNQMKKVHENLCGKCVLNDTESDDYVIFDYLKFGKVKVNGQVGGSFNDQFLRFSFVTDQTFVNDVILYLKKMIGMMEK